MTRAHSVLLPSGTCTCKAEDVYEHGLMQEVDNMNSFLEECTAQLEAEHSSAQREAEAFADVLAQVQRMISSYVRFPPQAEHHRCAWQVPVFRA